MFIFQRYLLKLILVWNFKISLLCPFQFFIWGLLVMCLNSIIFKIFVYKLATFSLSNPLISLLVFEIQLYIHLTNLLILSSWLLFLYMIKSFAHYCINKNFPSLHFTKHFYLPKWFSHFDINWFTITKINYRFILITCLLLNFR